MPIDERTGGVGARILPNGKREIFDPKMGPQPGGPKPPTPSPKPRGPAPRKEGETDEAFARRSSNWNMSQDRLRSVGITGGVNRSTADQRAAFQEKYGRTPSGYMPKPTPVPNPQPKPTPKVNPPPAPKPDGGPMINKPKLGGNGGGYGGDMKGPIGITPNRVPKTSVGNSLSSLAKRGLATGGGRRAARKAAYVASRKAGY